MIQGTVNEDLLPIVPIRVKKLDGDWEKLCALLDTGASPGLMLAETTVIQHRIALRHDRNSSAAVGYVRPPDCSIPTHPYWVKLQLGGVLKDVEAQIIKADHFPGVIGPCLLLNQRITVEAERNGAVEIGSIPEPTRLARIRSLIPKPERRLPSPDYIWNLPWEDIAVKDSEGRWQAFSANVDTGDSNALSLPPSKVEEFGLRLPDKCRVNTPCGPLDTICGEVEICWQGSTCTVRCIQREQKNPPLIGMELLRGNRITINVDVDCLPPVVEIAPIPRPALFNRDFLQSVTGRVRRRFAQRSWWRE